MECRLLQRKSYLGLALALVFFATQNLFAAEVISLRELQNNNNKSNLTSVVQKALKMEGKSSLRPIKASFASSGYQKFQQMYDGIPVNGYQVIINKTSAGKLRLHGYKVNGIDADVSSTQETYAPDEALTLAKQAFVASQIVKSGWSYERELVEKVIYITADKKAHVAYKVSFFADTRLGTPSRPMIVFDAITKERLALYDGLTFSESTATGPGGNEKVGKYNYGTDFPALKVEELSGGKCKMSTTDVETVDMKHEDPDGAAGGTPGGGGGPYLPFEFACGENRYQEINGAYSPINDAQAFGTVTFNMYQEWYKLNPIKTKLTLRVHYGQNFSNAFWDGKQMSFGDGGASNSGGVQIDAFHPLVALDVMAHEVSHGFTEFNSGLEYFGEPGSMNEAFSDMAGEAAEYYSRHKNDFLVGHDIVKKNATVNGQPFGDSLRYMEDPTKDGQSAGHVSQYKWGMLCDLCAQVMDPQLCGVVLSGQCMDVHHGSGIYNRAFFLLSTSPGWNTKMAFDVFVKANQAYWSNKTTFKDGAVGAKDAAEDLGYDAAAVKKAFSVVGIDI